MGGKEQQGKDTAIVVAVLAVFAAMACIATVGDFGLFGNRLSHELKEAARSLYAPA